MPLLSCPWTTQPVPAHGATPAHIHLPHTSWVTHTSLETTLALLHPLPTAARGQCQRPGGNSLPRVPTAPEGLTGGCAGSGDSRGSPGCSGIVWSHAWPAWRPRGKTDQNNSAQHPFTGGAWAEGNSKDMLMSPWREFNVETAPGCSEGQE